MTPDEIKKELKARGVTMAAIGRRMRPKVSTNVIWANVEQREGQKSDRARRAICRAIGREYDEVYGAAQQHSTAA